MPNKLHSKNYMRWNSAPIVWNILHHMWSKWRSSIIPQKNLKKIEYELVFVAVGKTIGAFGSDGVFLNILKNKIDPGTFVCLFQIQSPKDTIQNCLLSFVQFIMANLFEAFLLCSQLRFIGF